MSLLLLIRDDGKNGKTLGTRLMAQGHTVFLSDNSDDIATFESVVDAVVELEHYHDDTFAVVAGKATLTLPADDAALSTFTNAIAH